MTATPHCGYVAIIGRPNVGKSTLLNAFLQQKISITSKKPQTTRCTILGIKTVGVDQAIFIDTPGIHQKEKSAINRYMNRLANSVIVDADVLIVVIDATRLTQEDEFVLHRLQQDFPKEEFRIPILLIINKVDKLKDKNQLLPLIEKMKLKFPFTDIFPISAIKKDDVTELEQRVLSFLPEGPHLFPDTQTTDKSIQFQVAELVREKLIRATGQEIPYCSTVQVESFAEDEKIIRIGVIIWVERDGQKVIVIGKNGEKLKKIGSQARIDLERLFGKKVFLRLWVKVKEHWTHDERALRNLGYS